MRPDAAAVQSVIENGRGVPIGVPAIRHRVADGDRGQRAEFFDHFAAALFSLRRLGHISAGRQRMRREYFRNSA